MTNKLRLLKVVINNFRSFHGHHEFVIKPGPQFILATNHDVGYDSNGGGKSSLAHAISWILFGEISTGAGLDDVINYEAKEVSGELHFEGLIITRAKMRGQTQQLKFWGSEAKVAFQEDVRQTQEQLNEIIGLSPELFFNALWLDNASKSVQFLFKRPADRLQILMDLIGGERFKVWRKRVADAIAALDTKISLLQDRTTNAKEEAKRSQARIESLRENQEAEVLRCADFEATRSQRLYDLNERLEGLLIRHDMEKTEEVSLMREAGDAPALVLNNISNLSLQQTEADRTYRTIAGSPQAAGECPTCHRAFTPMELKAAMRSAQEAMARSKDLVSQLERERGRLEKSKKSWKLLDKVRANLIETTHEIQITNKEIETLNQATVDRRGVEKFATLIVNEEEALKDRQVAIQAMVDEVEQAMLRKPKLKIWLDAFGAKGLQNMLLDDIRNLITQFSAQYVTKLGGGILGLDMPPSDKGFVVNMIYRGRTVGVHNLSRGEVGRNGVAFVLSLRRALLYLNKCRLDFMVLDDIQGDMDATGVVSTIGMINALADEVGTIIVTMPSEHDHMKYDQIIRVSKKDGRSEIVRA